MSTAVLERVAFDIGCGRGKVNAPPVLGAAIAAQHGDAIERDAHKAASLREVDRRGERRAVARTVQSRRRRHRQVPSAVLSRVWVVADAHNDGVVVRASGSDDAPRGAGDGFR
eukprot:7390219-Prymnesium_polylepis.2